MCGTSKTYPRLGNDTALRYGSCTWRICPVDISQNLTSFWGYPTRQVMGTVPVEATMLAIPADVQNHVR